MNIEIGDTENFEAFVNIEIGGIENFGSFESFEDFDN